MCLRARLVAAIVLALLLSFAAGAGATAAADQADPKRIVASFDGNRHIRAELTNAAGQTLAASRPATTAIPPRWFQAAISPGFAPLALPNPPATRTSASRPRPPSSPRKNAPASPVTSTTKSAPSSSPSAPTPPPPPASPPPETPPPSPQHSTPSRTPPPPSNPKSATCSAA